MFYLADPREMQFILLFIHPKVLGYNQQTGRLLHWHFSMQDAFKNVWFTGVAQPAMFLFKLTNK